MVYNTAMTEGTETKPRTKVLKNGAIYDMDKGRIVAMKPEIAQVNTQITQANSGELQARRHELKRAAIARGANAVVAEGGKFDGTDLDFVEAIAEAQAIKALNPDDPKSTDAARFLLQEAGLSDKQAQPTQEANTADIIAALAQFAGQIMRENGGDNNYYRKHDEDIISVVPTEQDEAAGDVEAGGVDVVGGG